MQREDWTGCRPRTCRCRAQRLVCRDRVGPGVIGRVAARGGAGHWQLRAPRESGEARRQAGVPCHGNRYWNSRSARRGARELRTKVRKRYCTIRTGITAQDEFQLHNARPSVRPDGQAPQMGQTPPGWPIALLLLPCWHSTLITYSAGRHCRCMMARRRGNVESTVSQAARFFFLHF